jgi:hypothetical protein
MKTIFKKNIPYSTCPVLFIIGFTTELSNISSYKHFIIQLSVQSNLNQYRSIRFYNLDRHKRVCSMCDLNVVENEYHFILQCEKYIDVRRKYLKKYYWQRPSCLN